MTKEQALNEKLEQTKWQFPNHVVFKWRERVYHFDPNDFNEENIFSQTGLKVFREKDGNVALYDPEHFKIAIDGGYIFYKGAATEEIPQPINLKRYYHLFSGCECKTIDLSNWDFSEVVNMHYMFQSSSARTVVLGDADFSKCMDFDSCFRGCVWLQELVLGNYKIPPEVNVYRMFYGCNMLTRKYDKAEEELADIFKSGKWNSLQPVEWMEVF